jgi:DNA repair exonuclease SbcCD ATPase subunit/DNA repair exonuclease SbcCD nuclease subunit
MINKIAHLADIHVRKSTLRHQEYRVVFNNLYKKLNEDKPDRIVIAGDLFHDYIKLEGELLILASEFLNELSKIAKVIITRGNHDIARSAPNRTDAIEALVKVMNSPNIFYLDRTFQFTDENIVWCIWRHGDKRNSPWPKDFIKDKNKTYIDLFHDPINGSTDSEGYQFNSKTYRSPTEFYGDISMFGDIHKLQYLDTNKTKAYSSSLIEQKFDEGDNQFHGYLLWDVATHTAKEVRIENDYGHYTLDVNRFTDFDNLQLSIPNPPPNVRIRIKWKTLPAIRNVENTRKVDAYLQQNFNPISIKHYNDFVQEKKIKIEEESDIQNINKREVIHKVITEYLTKIGVKQDMINEVLELDTEIENRLDLEELTNIQWSIVKLKGKNFRSYDDIEIDWEDKDGLYQIVGENGVGKSTINQLITYILFGKSLETDFRKKFGDARFINNKLPVNSCEGQIILEANGEYYGIKRATTTKKNKDGELTAATTVASYYKLTAPTDKLDDTTNIEKLNEQDRFKTQDRINEIIGSYENFIRVTLTTSDTLNSVLSSDKALFIDSLLFDSGLNIFDLRLKEFKNYKDELIYDNRLTNFNATDQQNYIVGLNGEIKLKQEFIQSSKEQIDEHFVELDEIKGQRETLLQSMHQIDSELSSTNEIQINDSIEKLKVNLSAIELEESKIQKLIDSLKSSYDLARLNALQLEKDNHKNSEFEKRTAINKRRMEIEQFNSNLSSINGKIELLKREGGSIKKEIIRLNESKNCPSCGQSLGVEHESHIKQTIKEQEILMYKIAGEIKEKDNEKPIILSKIENCKKDIINTESIIAQDSVNFQSILEEIGKLTNDKQEVERRERLVLELNSFPVKKENVNLKISEQQNKLVRYRDQKLKIEENNKSKNKVSTLTSNIDSIQYQIDTAKNSIINMEAQIKNFKDQIKLKEDLITKYLDFERKEQVRKIYAESIHRDGLPTQILIDTLLPNINNILSKLLESTDFDVYLDKEDLRLKFFYNDHPNAIIDCISASGMERTFAVYALKIALNQINSKSKSTLLSIDEIMGKLKNEHYDKFIEIIHLSKRFYKKVLVIEHNEVNADYLLEITKNESGISKLS